MLYLNLKLALFSLKGSTILAQALPGRKWVFTNSDRRHAETCLRLLGIEDCFDGLICFESVMAAAHLKGMAKDNAPVICKPSRKVGSKNWQVILSSQHQCVKSVLMVSFVVWFELATPSSCRQSSVL